jgi:hypothetical protein
MQGAGGAIEEGAEDLETTGTSRNTTSLREGVGEGTTTAGEGTATVGGGTTPVGGGTATVGVTGTAAVLVTSRTKEGSGEAGAGRTSTEGGALTTGEEEVRGSLK